MNTNKHYFINIKKLQIMMNNQNFMLSPEAAAFLTALSAVVEKAFENADKKDARRHEERLEELKIERLRAEAEADKLRAEAESIRARSSQQSFKHRVKNA